MYWPRVARPHPPGALMGAQQEAVGSETAASRSCCLLTTSGLHLLNAECVLAEKTFRRLKAKYTGGRLRSGGQSEGEGGVGGWRCGNHTTLAFPSRGPKADFMM